MPNVDHPVDTTPTQHTPEVHAQQRFSVAAQFGALCRLQPKRMLGLLVQAYNDWSSDGASRLGAALAYYTLFSIAPTLIVITGIAALFVGPAAARGEIAPWLERLLSPEGARAAELMVQQHVTPTGGIVATIAGFVTLFLGTSALVNELRQSLNRVWRIEEHAPQDETMLHSILSMLGDRVYAFLVVVGAGLLVMVSMMVNTAVAAAGAYFQNWLPLPEFLLQAINFLVAFGLTTTMFTLVYKTVPDAYVAWGDAAVGALSTAFLFTLGGMVLSMFLGKAGGSPYGTAASVLALLGWVYYSAQVFFFGAELTRIFATDHGGRIVPRHRSIRTIVRRRVAGPAPA